MALRDPHHARQDGPGISTRTSMRAKTALAVAHPQAARVFAHETPARRTAHQRSPAHRITPFGGRQIADYRRPEAAGVMAPMAPPHLLLPYGPQPGPTRPDSQGCAVLGVRRLNASHRARAAGHVVAMILPGCGLEKAASDDRPLVARPYGKRPSPGGRRPVR